MPVHQYDTEEHFIPMIGRLRLGEKRKNAKGVEYPAALPYFVTKDAPGLFEAYGDKPDTLLVYPAFPTVKDSWENWMERYSSVGCICRGDGAQIVKLIDPQKEQGLVVARGKVIKDYTDASMDGEAIPVKAGDVALCPGPARDRYPRCKECKPTGRLKVLIRDPNEPTELVNRQAAYYMLTTRSAQNIQNLNRAFNTLQMIAENIGCSIMQLPAVLKRTKRKVQRFDKNNKPIQKDDFFVELEFDAVMQHRAASAIAQAARALLPAPDVPVSGVEDGEFYDGDDMMTDARADLLALRADPPGSLETALEILSGFYPEIWDDQWFFAQVRVKSGVAENAKIKFPTCWPAMVDVMLAVVDGELAFPEGE
jgi:hypothetical protein